MRLLRLRRHADPSENGQVLVMVAAALTILLGFSALVVDIGMLWNAHQDHRGVTDAAALAGVQEMQNSGSRGLSASSREEARGAAMANILDQLEVTTGLPACPVGGGSSDADGDGKAGYAVDVRNCAIPGTDYHVSILTRSPLCLHCYDDERSIMVELTRPNLPTILAGMFGRTGWPVRQTSVASIGYTADFAVITLRPPATGYNGTGTDALEDDIEVAGTARLRVSVGDIGTNTNLVFTGGATAAIDDGYMVHHYDNYQAWGTFPKGKRLFALIEDPNHTIPTRTGAPTFTTLAQARMTDDDCLFQRDKVPAQYTWRGAPVNTTDVTKIHCLKPGIYSFMPVAPSTPGNMILFAPGVFFLDQGLDNKGAAYGGYDAEQPGVSLVVKRTATLFTRSAEGFAINAGGNFLDGTAGEALPAVGFDGVPVRTGTGPAGNDPDLTISLIVEKDPNCLVQIPYPTGCDDANNDALDLNGGSTLYLAGVQYAPTDNVRIGGASGGQGYAGRIVAWTVWYHGNADVTQAYPGASAANGVLRLDAACTGGGSTGMTNALCNP